MKLDPQQEAQVIDRLVAELTERAWKKLEGELEEVTCISVQRLAGMLDLSTPQTRRVLQESIDFGPRDTRITLAQAKRLIESRTVSNTPS